MNLVCPPPLFGDMGALIHEVGHILGMGDTYIIDEDTWQSIPVGQPATQNMRNCWTYDNITSEDIAGIRNVLQIMRHNMSAGDCWSGYGNNASAAERNDWDYIFCIPN